MGWQTLAILILKLLSSEDWVEISALPDLTETPETHNYAQTDNQPKQAFSFFFDKIFST